MPTFSATGCDLYYEDEGNGRPVVFIHGFTCSSRFFDRQREHFATSHRFIAPDLRSHGRSEKVTAGNTVAIQTRDIHELLVFLDARDAVLVGWSNGVFNVWQYLQDYGKDRLAAVVLIDESPCPVRRDDWAHGYLDLDSLIAGMAVRQTDAEQFTRGQFVPHLFVGTESDEDLAMLADEILMTPPTIAAAVGLDSMGRDWRPLASRMIVPTLVCTGAKSFMAEGNRTWLREHLPDARFAVFEESGHMLFWEEADAFNTELDGFILSLPERAGS